MSIPRCALLLLFVTLVKLCFSQKHILDSAAVADWSTLNNEAKISSDGRYVLYVVDNVPTGHAHNDSSKYSQFMEQMFYKC